MNTILCFGELKEIDESKCVQTKDGELFLPEIHFIQGDEHWTETGLPVDPATLDPVESYDRERGIIKLKPVSTLPSRDHKIPGTLGEGDDEDKGGK
jgi:hypothetical protein